MTNIYQLTAEYQRLLHKEEYSHEDMKALDDLPGIIEDKLIQRAYVVRDLEYLIASINCELQNMTKRRDRLQNNLENLQKSILHPMQDNSMSVIDKCPNFKIAIHNKKPRVDPYDKAQIPDEFWIVEHKPVMKLDTNLLHEVLDRGDEVPGARLVDPYRLAIK